MKDVAERLADAKRAHAEAVSARNGAAGKVSHARTAVAAATGARDTLLRAAAAQGDNSAGLEQLRQVDSDLRDKQLAADLADAVWQHANTNAEGSEIELLDAQAAVLREQVEQAADNAVTTAVAVDDAYANLAAALRAFDAARLGHYAAQRNASSHNAMLEDIARRNQTMSAKHRSEWPKVRTISLDQIGDPPAPTVVALFRRGRFLDMMLKDYSWPRAVVEPPVAPQIASELRRPLPAHKEAEAA